MGTKQSHEEGRTTAATVVRSTGSSGGSFSTTGSGSRPLSSGSAFHHVYSTTHQDAPLNRTLREVPRHSPSRAHHSHTNSQSHRGTISSGRSGGNLFLSPTQSSRGHTHSDRDGDGGRERSATSESGTEYVNMELTFPRLNQRFMPWPRSVAGTRDAGSPSSGSRGERRRRVHAAGIHGHRRLGPSVPMSSLLFVRGLSGMFSVCSCDTLTLHVCVRQLLPCPI